MLLTCSDICCWFYYKAHNINFINSLLSSSYHIFTKLILSLMDTRRINNYNLSSLICIHCLYPVSCCLWLIRCYRNLLPYNIIHKCRLANIRSSNKCYKSRFHIVVARSSTAAYSTGFKHFI